MNHNYGPGIIREQKIKIELYYVVVAKHFLRIISSFLMLLCQNVSKCCDNCNFVMYYHAARIRDLLDRFSV